MRGQERQLEVSLSSTKKFIDFLSSEAANITQICSIKFEPLLRRIAFRAISNKDAQHVCDVLRVTKYLAMQNDINGIHVLLKAGLPQVLTKILAFITQLGAARHAEERGTTVKLFMENALLIVPMLNDQSKWLKANMASVLAAAWHSFFEVALTTMMFECINQVVMSLPRQDVYALRSAVCSSPVAMDACKSMMCGLGLLGDYQTQAGLIELMVRVTPSSTRRALATQWNNDDSILGRLFSEINYESFDQTVRSYLNAINAQHSDGVTSLPLKKLMLGDQELKEHCWLDLCFRSRKLTISFFLPGDSEGTHTFESFDFSNVKDYVVAESSDHLIFAMTSQVPLNQIFDDDVSTDSDEVRLFIDKSDITLARLRSMVSLLWERPCKEESAGEKSSLPEVVAIPSDPPGRRASPSSQHERSFSQDVVLSSQPKQSKPADAHLLPASMRRDESRQMRRRLELHKVDRAQLVNQSLQETMSIASQAVSVTSQSSIGKLSRPASCFTPASQVIPETPALGHSERASCDLHLSQLHADQSGEADRSRTSKHGRAKPSKRPRHDRMDRSGSLQALPSHVLSRKQSPADKPSKNSDASRHRDKSSDREALNTSRNSHQKSSRRHSFRDTLGESSCAPGELLSRGHHGDASAHERFLRDEGSAESGKKKVGAQHSRQGQRKPERPPPDDAARGRCHERAPARVGEAPAYRDEKDSSKEDPKPVRRRETRRSRRAFPPPAIESADKGDALTPGARKDDAVTTAVRGKHAPRERADKVNAQFKDLQENLGHSFSGTKPTKSTVKVAKKKRHSESSKAVDSSNIAKSAPVEEKKSGGRRKPKRRLSANEVLLRVVDSDSDVEGGHHGDRGEEAECAPPGSADDVPPAFRKWIRGEDLEEEGKKAGIRSRSHGGKGSESVQHFPKVAEVGSCKKIRFSCDPYDFEGPDHKPSRKKRTEKEKLFDSSGLSSAASTCSDASWLHSSRKKSRSCEAFGRRPLRTFSAKRPLGGVLAYAKSPPKPTRPVRPSVEVSSSSSPEAPRLDGSVPKLCIERLSVGECMSRDCSKEVSHEECESSNEGFESVEKATIAASQCSHISVVKTPFARRMAVIGEPERRDDYDVAQVSFLSFHRRSPSPVRMPDVTPASRRRSTSRKSPSPKCRKSADKVDRTKTVAEERNTTTPRETATPAQPAAAKRRRHIAARQNQKRPVGLAFQSGRELTKSSKSVLSVKANGSGDTSSESGGCSSNISNRLSRVLGKMDGSDVRKGGNESLKRVCSSIMRNMVEVQKAWEDFTSKRTSKLSLQMDRVTSLSRRHEELMEELAGLEGESLGALKRHQERFDAVLARADASMSGMNESNNSFYEQECSFERQHCDVMRTLSDDVTNHLKKLTDASQA